MTFVMSCFFVSHSLGILFEDMPKTDSNAFQYDHALKLFNNVQANKLKVPES